MKKTILSLFLVVVATGLFARSFDGTQKIYLKANAVSWWTDANAAQRAVLDNTTLVIGVIEDADRKIYAFTIPAGDYTNTFAGYDRMHSVSLGLSYKFGTTFDHRQHADLDDSRLSESTRKKHRK